MALDERAATILSRGWYGERLTKDDMEYLLTFRSGSPVASLTISLADRLGKKDGAGAGFIEARIPASTGPCSGCCSFCRLGEGIYDGGFDDIEDEVLERYCAELGGYKDVRTVRLATTADMDMDLLIHLVEVAKRALRRGTIISVETRDLSPGECRELKEAGVEEAYCSCRIGEGRDTPYAPEDRKETMKNFVDAGFRVTSAAGPFGPEHTPREIAESFFDTVDMGCASAEVYPRRAIPDTPYANKGEIVPRRMNQIRAAATVCTSGHGTSVRNPCPGPYVRGRNVAVVDYAGPDRRSGLETARRRLFNAGYDRIIKTDGTSVDLTLAYLMQTGSV